MKERKMNRKNRYKYEIRGEKWWSRGDNSKFVH